jgi:hypothetical protein
VPYVFADTESLLDVVTTIAAPGWTLYKQQPAASEQTITFQSLQGTGGCLGDLSPREIEVYPAVPVFDLSTLYTAPFSVR